MNPKEKGEKNRMAKAKDTEIIVPGGHGRSFVAGEGQYISVIDLEGQQVGDFLAFNARDMEEHLSTNHTMASRGKMVPSVGDILLTNYRNPILEVVADEVGRHDMLIAACDPWRYLYDYGVKDHRNCSDNFLDALSSYGLKRHQLPQPVNLFQNMEYHPDGRLEFKESISRPGQKVVFRALMDIVGALSACPMDLNPVCGFKVTDLKVVISDQAP